MLLLFYYNILIIIYVYTCVYLRKKMFTHINIYNLHCFYFKKSPFINDNSLLIQIALSVRMLICWHNCDH
jgi:hypothetical protein